MNIKKLLAVFTIVFIAPFYSYADSDPNIVGVYEKVPKHDFKYDGKTVEIIEFLSFYCGHCYQFEKSIPVIRGNFPKKITWKTIPIHWGKSSPKPGEAYLLAEEEGKGEQMKKALFEAFFLQRRDIGDVEVLEDIAMKIGLGFDFSRRLRAGEKSGEIEKAFEQVRKYGIKETPSLIIAGNLKTAPGMLNNSTDLLRDNTILILKSIFEKSRK